MSEPFRWMVRGQRVYLMDEDGWSPDAVGVVRYVEKYDCEPVYVMVDWADGSSSKCFPATLYRPPVLYPLNRLESVKADCSRPVMIWHDEIDETVDDKGRRLSSYPCMDDETWVIG